MNHTKAHIAMIDHNDSNQRLLCKIVTTLREHYETTDQVFVRTRKNSEWTLRLKNVAM